MSSKACSSFGVIYGILGGLLIKILESKSVEAYEGGFFALVGRPLPVEEVAVLRFR